MQTVQAWLMLGLLPGLGPVAQSQLVARFGSAKEALLAERAKLLAAGCSLEQLQARDALLEERPGEIRARYHTVCEMLAKPGHGAICIDDALYPPSLREIYAPPPVLFYRGHPEVLAPSHIAIVGSRQCSAYGESIAREWSRDLSAHLVVTSGLALGIDAAAHEGALAGSGKTAAVLGHGLDRVYPARHRAMAERIVSAGCLVSEFYPGEKPLPDHFPRRNRIISGLSRAVLVIEAAPESGSLITARYAAEQGRDVLAVPGSIHHMRARGCHSLIREGAALVSCVGEVLEAVLGSDPRTAICAPLYGTPDTAVENTLQSAMLSCLAAGAQRLPAIVEALAASGVEVALPDIKSQLLLLEMRGVLAVVDGEYTLVARQRP